MSSSKRRKEIAAFLASNKQPVRASTLATMFDVSRQVIVGDIALLRASGMEIIATPRGYINAVPTDSQLLSRTIACSHAAEDTQKELYIIVDHGGSIQNVIVEHPIYGQLCGELRLTSRYDIDSFIEKSKKQNAPLLSKLTDGIHLHTITCQDEEIYNRIMLALKSAGILYQKN